MARREIVQYYDDLDHTPLEGGQLNTIDFSVNNVDYTIDLSPENKAKFDEAIGPFVKVARRRARTANTGRRTTGRTSNPARNRAIREWAHKEGIAVPERGRISADIVAQYDRAHGTV